ncbi:MAG: hypothetical protein K8T26_06080 [Lentisphaerae bacterium]|nr:hypothetical protein [Lentisphaerota bacterium]
MTDMAGRWRICGQGIEWDVAADARLPHEDHLEMSGQRVSLLVRYGVQADGGLALKRRLVWPSLRTIPNNTHGSFQRDIADEQVPYVETRDGRVIEHPVRFRLDGVLTVHSRTRCGLEIVREIFPTVETRAAMERITITNAGAQPVSLTIGNPETTTWGRGCNGVYAVESRMDKSGTSRLEPGGRLVIGWTLSARVVHEPCERLDVDAEFLRRRARVGALTAPLQLETGIPELDTAFHFAKIRAGESIFRTRGGLMHSPGGTAYYAATWCNDQVEYAGPWFAFTGDAVALEASLNAYRHYIPFMGPEYTRIPSSVIAEGFDIWEGAGDRGDAAMYAYGASRFALTTGDRTIAAELWPAIEWTLEYCRRKRLPEGVVASDCDELEKRLPAGKANLCTSALYYGALRAAAGLADDLGRGDAGRRYEAQALELASAIETYFGRDLRGFATYRYYEGNEVLRSWICIPLCMGLLARATATVDAMFSPFLWTENGMLSQEGDKIFWDRSTLYGFRGAFFAGATDRVMPLFRQYSARRLLGDHVPYPIEAWPEGNQRHLSAESALYCRVITEGLLGMEPAGLHSFRFTPRLPAGWDRLALRKICAFGTRFDIHVESQGACVVRDGKTIWRGPLDVIAAVRLE